MFLEVCLGTIYWSTSTRLGPVTQMVMRCCLNSIIILHLKLLPASSDTLETPKVISVDLKLISALPN